MKKEMTVLNPPKIKKKTLADALYFPKKSNRIIQPIFADKEKVSENVLIYRSAEKLTLIKDPVEALKEAEKLQGTYSSAMNQLSCDPFTPAIEVKVMHVLHSFCRRKNLKNADDRPTTQVSQKKICSRVGISEKALRNILWDLEEKGWIDVTHRNRATSIIILNVEPIVTFLPGAKERLQKLEKTKIRLKSYGKK